MAGTCARWKGRAPRLLWVTVGLWLPLSFCSAVIGSTRSATSILQPKVSTYITSMQPTIDIPTNNRMRRDKLQRKFQQRSSQQQDICQRSGLVVCSAEVLTPLNFAVPHRRRKTSGRGGWGEKSTPIIRKFGTRFCRVVEIGSNRQPSAVKPANYR